MHLFAMLGTGPTVYHQGAWRYPSTDNDFLSSDFIARLAQTLERAKFDAIFFADSLTFFDNQAEKGGTLYMLDPVVVAAAVAHATKQIGIGVTVSSSYFEPYAIARSLGSIDMISGGRLAWNIVTGGVDAEAKMFGQAAALPRSERYERATEVVEACLKFWDSFPADAIIADRDSGKFIEVSKLRPFEYQGKHVRTSGFSSLPSSPQGRPILMQAGSSPQGRDFAACFGEVVFVLYRSAEGVREFVEDMTARLAKFGRSRKDCIIVPLVNVVAADTGPIARDQWDLLNSLVDQETSIGWASGAIGVDLSLYPPQMPIQELDLASLDPVGKGSSGYLKVFLQHATSRGDMTVGEAAVLLSNSATPAFVGNGDEVTDQLVEFVDASGADGVVISAPISPGGFEAFARLVVPRLQARGRFRTDYPGTTLRSTVFG